MVKKYFRYIKDTLSCRFCRQFSLQGSTINWIAYNISPNKNNSVIIENSKVSHCSFNVNGTNNKIVIKNNADVAFHGITIEGDNNEVVYDGCLAVISVRIRGNGCKVSVGKGSLIDESSSIVCMGQSNYVDIGEGCMFAENVEIWDSDTHLITDLMGCPINPSKPVVIENHVWLGKGVKVMKGVTIGHNSVVGMGSIVTKDIPQHSIAAGNPAKVVKNGVDWKFGFIDI